MLLPNLIRVGRTFFGERPGRYDMKTIIGRLLHCYGLSSHLHIRPKPSENNSLCVAPAPCLGLVFGVVIEKKTA